MNKFKVVFIGYTCSGKTSLINLLLKRPNPLNNGPSSVLVYQYVMKMHGKKDCKFSIWDTPGHKIYQQCANIPLKIRKEEPLIAIICYDLHSKNGGEDIQYYIDQVKSCNQNAKIVILGTKQNLGEHENLKNINKQFPEYRFYKVGLNGEEILTQIFHQFYEDIIAQQTLIQQELQIVQDRKFIKNKLEQSLIKKQKNNGIWGLCFSEFDD